MKFMRTKLAFIWLLGLLLIISCNPDESLNIPQKPDAVLETELDKYIEANFTEKYGVAIRYLYKAKYVGAFERATPPKLDVVKPMLDFLEEFWIEPFLEVENGEEFFKKHVPAEVIFLGGFIFNSDGTVTLGTADAGARITLTNVNAIDPSDEDWRTLQLQTIYHEFAHIIHQNYRLPVNFETISPTGYTSAGSWFSITDGQALERGFVSNYATSSPNEDYAETAAVFLFDPDFDVKFMDDEVDCNELGCEQRNLGRQRIREKMEAIKDHYMSNTNVDLEKVREAVQARL